MDRNEMARELAQIVRRFRVDEIELHQGQQRIRLAWHPTWEWDRMEELARLLDEASPGQ